MLHHQYYLEALLDAGEDAITIVDSNMKVVFWNNAAVQTYNIDRPTILHKPINDFFHHDDLMVFKVVETRESVKNAYHRPRKDKHVVINAVPIINKEDQLIGALSIERDITQIVKLNNNLETTVAELDELRQKIYTDTDETPFSKLVGNSLPLQQSIQIARKAAKSDATTLILGESGTGKEVCARAIHETSDRSSAPFIPVNCGAIPSALFESELFGYEGGSFTGAEKKGKAGKIEMADGGTLFLDEVGELPLEMQVKLLRVLQENNLYRIGDSKGRTINVRFIAATNHNLEQLMEENKFRSDLFYRLNVIQLTMPPLRDRIDDINELSNIFLKQFALKYQVPVPEIEQEAFELLLQYKWPGNIRELRNIMERIIILTEQAQVTKHNISSYLPTNYTSHNRLKKKVVNSLPQEKEDIEKELIMKILQETNGNKSEAATRLGISRVTLYTKIKKYGIWK